MKTKEQIQGEQEALQIMQAGFAVAESESVGIDALNQLAYKTISTMDTFSEADIVRVSPEWEMMFTTLSKDKVRKWFSKWVAGLVKDKVVEEINPSIYEWKTWRVLSVPRAVENAAPINNKLTPPAMVDWSKTV